MNCRVVLGLIYAVVDSAVVPHFMPDSATVRQCRTRQDNKGKSEVFGCLGYEYEDECVSLSTW